MTRARANIVIAGSGRGTVIAIIQMDLPLTRRGCVDDLIISDYIHLLDIGCPNDSDFQPNGSGARNHYWPPHRTRLYVRPFCGNTVWREPRPTSVPRHLLRSA